LPRAHHDAIAIPRAGQAPSSRLFVANLQSIC
jgi:hypothetical protein